MASVTVSCARRSPGSVFLHIFRSILNNNLILIFPLCRVQTQRKKVSKLCFLLGSRTNSLTGALVRFKLIPESVYLQIARILPFKRRITKELAISWHKTLTPIASLRQRGSVYIHHSVAAYLFWNQQRRRNMDNIHW